LLSVRKADSFSLAERRKLISIRMQSTVNGIVIEPVPGDLNQSIPKMNAIPDTCPISRRKPFEVPSDTGNVTSAPYWNPIGPELSRK
jgi:hypothetical protein